MFELDDKIKKMALTSGAIDNNPYSDTYTFDYTALSQFHGVTVSNVYNDLRDYIRWTLQDTIDNDSLEIKIMFEIMDKFENKYEGILNGIQ
jgi:hypothetical protein